jgi:hypothetical protein
MMTTCTLRQTWRMNSSIFFPQEDIVFISEGSLTEIKNPDLLLGYDSIFFDNTCFDTEFIVEGFSEEVNVAGCENYALAA